MHIWLYLWHSIGFMVSRNIFTEIKLVDAFILISTIFCELQKKDFAEYGPLVENSTIPDF